VQMVLLLRKMFQYKSLTLAPQPMFILGSRLWSTMLSQSSFKALMLQSVSFFPIDLNSANTCTSFRIIVAGNWLALLLNFQAVLNFNQELV